MAVFRLVTPILSANSIVRAGELWTSCPCLSSVVLINGINIKGVRMVLLDILPLLGK